MDGLSLGALAFIQQAAAFFASQVVTAWLAAGAPPEVVTSYHRDPAENARAGGDPESQHLIATAVDMDGTIDPEFQRQMRQRGLVVLPRGTHTHVQLWPAHLRAVRTIAPSLIVPRGV